jgi:hypothetical protein
MVVAVAERFPEYHHTAPVEADHLRWQGTAASVHCQQRTESIEWQSSFLAAV